MNSPVQSPLKQDRQLFRRISTPAGQELENYGDGTTLTPGDRITVRLTVTTDRDMEFVHLKDRRGSGLEPATALSGYRYQDGLGFYFSPTDLAVNYFFDPPARYLCAGVRPVRSAPGRIQQWFVGNSVDVCAEFQCAFAGDEVADWGVTRISCTASLNHKWSFEMKDDGNGEIREAP